MKKIIFIVSIFMASSANAGLITSATSVSSPQGEFGGTFQLDNIINQSGLSAGYTSGVTDFTTFTSGTTHDALNGTGFTGTESVGPQ